MRILEIIFAFIILYYGFFIAFPKQGQRISAWMKEVLRKERLYFNKKKYQKEPKAKGKILSVSGEGDLLATVEDTTVKIWALEIEEEDGSMSFCWDPDEQ